MPRAELAEAAERAVAAWVLFGGVGARTRRGCGSLWCVGDDVRFRPRTEAHPEAEVERWVQVGGNLWLPRLTTGAAVASALRVPLLQGARVVTRLNATNDAIAAWKAAVAPMQRFRQGIGVGRNAGPGLSRWPEPYSVRLAWPGLDPDHNAQTHPVNVDDGDEHQRWYPRANLGLPIVFGQLGKKPFPTLQGAQDGASRMASPVILKALPIGTNQFVPLVFVLQAPHVSDAGMPQIELSRRDVADVPLAPDRLAMPANALFPDPRGLTTGGGSIRDAFLAWLGHPDCWGQTAVML